MKKSKVIKYHSTLLSQIAKFKRAKWCKLINKSTPLDGVKAYFKPYKNEFKIEFQHDIFRPKGRSISTGQTYKKIVIKFTNSVFILDSLFLGHQSSNKTTGTVYRIYSKGFHENKSYYYRLVIPLEKELSFHYQIDQTHFTTDLGYMSRTATTIIIQNEGFELCCIHNAKKEYYLIIESTSKHYFKDFEEKANAIKIALGYITGHFPGNQGFYFTYSAKSKIVPKYIRFDQFRDTMKNGYAPIYSNSYGWLRKNKLAKKYYTLLRTLTLSEFSNLCDKTYSNSDFASSLMLILESSIASLLFMPGGFAIALESLSEIITNDLKVNLCPITDKTIMSNIKKEFKNILTEYSSVLPVEGLAVLNTRIDQINQSTNKARLKAPFEKLKICLTSDDLKTLETRNDFLHGRVPDILDIGKVRPLDRMNKDMYYSAMRLYTLINVLILKWVGYDNRVVNFPKIYESYTQVKVNEEPFRPV